MATLADPAETRRTTRNQPADASSAVRPSRAAANGEFWRAGAPKRLRDGGTPPHTAWKLYWNERQTPATAAALCRSAGSPLAWALDRQALPPECRELLEVLDVLARGPRRRLRFVKGRRNGQFHSAITAWLAEARIAPAQWQLGIGCLAATYALAEVGGALEAPLGWELLDFLHATATQAHSWTLDGDASGEAVLAQQLLAGELPLALAYFFGDMAPLNDLRVQARDRLSEGLFELLNGEGLVRAAHLPSMRALAACWTRCQALGATWKKGCFSDMAGRQFQALVRQAIRWSDPQGRALLAEPHSEPWSRDFLRSLLRLGGGKPDGAAAGALLGGGPLGRVRSRTEARSPKASYQCEWAGLAVMRSDWGRKSPCVAIDYSGREMRLDVRLGRKSLAAGAWRVDSSIDGQAAAAAGNWDQVCWFSDKRADYIEFAQPLAGGGRLERQIILAHREQFLLLIDHLQHSAVADLAHAWDLPLALNAAFVPEDETREGRLVIEDRPTARALPLALPEWRIDPRMGDLAMHQGRLRLAERTRGRVLACPLLLDFAADRIDEPCTWRQLTVAEGLAIQSPDSAIGYRMQCGDRQWMAYRSQGPRGNRTLLGQNTSSEFLVARFVPRTGLSKAIVEVEG